MKLNPDADLVKQIREEIKNNFGYCPCVIENTEDSKCPCKDMRTKHICICGLYVKNED
jgi:ferredoxin-thioredoxin reductase catalytic subunit